MNEKQRKESTSIIRNYIHDIENLYSFFALITFFFLLSLAWQFLFVWHSKSVPFLAGSMSPLGSCLNDFLISFACISCNTIYSTDGCFFVLSFFLLLLIKLTAFCVWRSIFECTSDQLSSRIRKKGISKCLACYVHF